MLVPSLRRFTKIAEEPYPGFHSLATQQYAPIQGRRELGPEEEEEIAAGKSRWIPKIFKSYSTPASELMSSPGKGALMAGGIGGGVGALVGGMFGARMQGGGQAVLPDGFRPAAGAAIGGLGLGGLAALLEYYSRNKRNEDIEELMRRLPPGATRRDLLSDPAYQKDREMAQSRSNNQALIAAMARRR